MLFDIGGVAGGILAGHLSDRFNARSMVSAGFVFTAIPCLYLYREYGHMSYTANIVLMMLSGVFVNGPYALITTAVSADLGTHESLKGNAQVGESHPCFRFRLKLRDTVVGSTLHQIFMTSFFFRM